MCCRCYIVSAHPDRLNGCRTGDREAPLRVRSRFTGCTREPWIEALAEYCPFAFVESDTSLLVLDRGLKEWVVKNRTLVRQGSGDEGNSPIRISGPANRISTVSGRSYGGGSRFDDLRTGKEIAAPAQPAAKQ
jgi:hypothetical protein